YRPYREGEHFFVEETQPGGHTWVQPITHAIGSGDTGMAFYTRTGDRFFQIPLDWFPRAGAWGLDPGFTQTNLRFFFALDATCIACHTDPPRRSPTAAEVFFDPLPAGVGCERCHGPGAKHVASSKREDIVNPKRLTAQQQIEICAQCHQDTASVYLPGTEPFGYRPGDPLDGFRRNYLREPAAPDRVILLEHPDRMTRSACFLRSDGKLTCTTCHDPHTSSRGRPAAYWRERCNACHGAKNGCTETKPARAKNGDDCVACHMRRGATDDIPSVDVVDHWIQTRPPPIARGAAAPPERVVAWSEHLGSKAPAAEAEGTLAVALDRAGRPDDAEQHARAAVGDGTHVPEVYELLAARLGARHRYDDAARMLARALAFAPDRRRTLLAYAMSALDADTPAWRAEAEHALDRMLALDPADQRALEIEGMLRVREHRYPEAKQLLARAAAAGPAGGAAHVGLAALALHDHDADTAKRELEAARRIAPDDPWILEHLGSAAPTRAPTPASAWLPSELRSP
ncbi:MAG TPA: multiheme c-type cytochrome, partial [Kofleriaceae bacterium]|nr:multiheme c-type cytochrome [Kofleriaceae bacterium]